MSEQSKSLMVRAAEQYGMEPRNFEQTLMATIIPPGKDGRPAATREQVAALLIVAEQYQLNPFTKEIYAFPAKGGGIVPVVGVDGWARLINGHKAFDGIKFEYHDAPDGKLKAITCSIYRKDLAHPVQVTEYLEECQRSTDPWLKLPRRMLRHKALIQCGRVAFSLSGIYDEDEAERIVEAEVRQTVTAASAANLAQLTERLEAEVADPIIDAAVADVAGVPDAELDDIWSKPLPSGEVDPG